MAGLISYHDNRKEYVARSCMLLFQFGCNSTDSLHIRVYALFSHILSSGTEDGGFGHAQ